MPRANLFLIESWVIVTNVDYYALYQGRGGGKGSKEEEIYYTEKQLIL